jgi:hypothetical protein
MASKKVVVRKKRPADKPSPLDKVSQRLDDAGKAAELLSDEAARAAKRRAAKLALGIIDFQKTTFEHTLAVVGRAQDASAGLLTGMLKEADWVPEEGKQVAQEWTELVTRGRQEFEKTLNKSFDLITDYIGRQDYVAAPPAAAKKDDTPAPKKRKVVAKRKAAKKP